MEECDSTARLPMRPVPPAPGLTRQYLLPMPSGRQKFDEPTFRPAIDPKSLVRPAGCGSMLSGVVWQLFCAAPSERGPCCWDTSAPSRAGAGGEKK